MQAAKAICSSLVFGTAVLTAAAAPGPDCSVDTLDGSVLLHRDLQVLRASEELPLAPDAAISELAERAVKRASHHLQGFEAKMEAEQKEYKMMLEYLEKVRRSFGQTSTLFSELQGLMPAGVLDKADKATGVKLLGALTHEPFAKAVKDSIKDFSLQIDSYSQRTEKQMSNLRVASAKSSEAELPNLINSFFATQQHIIASVLDQMETSLEKAIRAIPEEYSYLSAFAGPMVSKLSSSIMNRVTVTNATTFCGDMDGMLVDQFMPMLNETALAGPVVDQFAKANLPAVAPVVAMFAKDLAVVSKTKLTPLRAKVRSWAEQTCALVIAASPAMG